MIKKAYYIALIFTLIFSSSSYALRAPLKFSEKPKVETSVDIKAVQANVAEKIEKHVNILKGRYKKTEEYYRPLPEVEFSTEASPVKYKYTRDDNRIVFYPPITEEICWLAYGEWLSQNEADLHTDKDDIKLWNSEHIQYLMDSGYVNPEEVKDLVILDVASGVGIPGVLIAKSGAGQVTCLDVSEVMLEAAQKKAMEFNLENVIFKQGSVFQLPFGSDLFDMVFVNRTLFRQPGGLRRIALSEILRVLKPKGKMQLLEWYLLKDLNLNKLSLGWDGDQWLSEIGRVGFEKELILNPRELEEATEERLYMIGAYKSATKTSSKLKRTLFSITSNACLTAN
ncbi:MAG: class I SAM-dependent methyltransferase [Candidatus Omnitrophica bacterium]|nr:class I SAM-dependent methyltransferase [Candidatus Omnitrophota bacterium]